MTVNIKWCCGVWLFKPECLHGVYKCLSEPQPVLQHHSSWRNGWLHQLFPDFLTMNDLCPLCYNQDPIVSHLRFVQVKQIGQLVCQDPGFYGPLTAEDVQVSVSTCQG